MNIKSHSSPYHRKIIDVIKYYLKDFKNPKILEFGVRTGISTNFFLDLCNKNNGKLISVDIDNYKNLFKNKNWTFIHSRDDNYEYIEKFLPKKLDIIHLDSLHEAKHVAKIIYYYYPLLKPGGIFLVDDISCLPYLRGTKKNTLTETVKNWQEYQPEYFVLPHPSPRNNIWLKKNPWFEKKLVPKLKKKIKELIL